MTQPNELTDGDELHITVEGDKTLPLTVRAVEETKTDTIVWLGYDGQEYAKMSKSGVTNDEYDYTLMTLYSGDNEIVGVENIEVV